MATLLRLVLDTNILISAIVFGGKPRLIFNDVLSGKFQLVTSSALLEEFRGVLSRTKFNFPFSMIENILNELTLISQIVEPHTSLNIIRSDPTDNRVLECAHEANADYIISGDIDLLKLKEFEEIPILSPDEFIRNAVAT